MLLKLKQRFPLFYTKSQLIFVQKSLFHDVNLSLVSIYRNSTTTTAAFHFNTLFNVDNPASVWECVVATSECDYNE